MMVTETQIVAVVVLYKQSLFETTSYQTFLKDAPIRYLVYDNSPEKQEIEEEKITYIHNPKNPGVSKAYNEAIKWANGLSATHLLLLDSDSAFPDNTLENYKAAVASFPSQLILPSLVSSGRKISPFYFSNGKTHYGDGIQVGELTLGNKLPINSGVLLPLKNLGEMRFNENLPLDWSDVYFFRKLSKTPVVARHISLTIQHGLSEHEERSFDSACFRFDLYLKGIPEVSNNKGERLMMYFWAKLKALKLSLQYRSSWFFIQYLKRFYE